MTKVLTASTAVLLIAGVATAQSVSETQKERPVLYTFAMETIDGTERPLSAYEGEVLLIVNVASFCGYTSQYKDLEAVYRKYKDRGLRVLAFPANDFGNQEPGTNEEIREFCSMNYDVTFDLFSKISVRGDDQHALYRYLTRDTKVPGEVKWNFQKYLVNRNGDVVAMYPSKTRPTDKVFIEHVERLLAEKD